MDEKPPKVKKRATKNSPGYGSHPNSKAAGGRPRAELHMLTIQKMARFGGTREDVASFCGVTIGKLDAFLRENDTTYSEVYESQRGHLRLSLRRAQWHKALVEKNTVMQIWLGKNELGQTDRQEIGFDQDKPVRFFRMDMGKKLNHADPVATNTIPKGQDDE